MLEEDLTDNNAHLSDIGLRKKWSLIGYIKAQLSSLKFLIISWQNLFNCSHKNTQNAIKILQEMQNMWVPCLKKQGIVTANLEIFPENLGKELFESLDKWLKICSHNSSLENLSQTGPMANVILVI